MKKTLLVLVVLLAAAAVGYSVYGARDVHRGIVAGIQEEEGAEVLEESFAWGFPRGHSRVLFAVEPEPDSKLEAWAEEQEGEGPALAFQLENEIAWGAAPLVGWLAAGASGSPVMSEVDSVMTLDGRARSSLEEQVGPLPALTATTRVHQSGMGESQLRMPAHRFQGETEDGEPYDVRWKGLEAEAVFTGDMGRVAGVVRLPGLTARIGEARFEMGEAEWTQDYADDPSGLGTGQTHARLETLELVGEDEEMVFSVTAWEVHQDTRIRDGLLHVDVDWSIEALRFLEEEFGPAVLELKLRNLHAESLKDARDQLEADEPEGDAAAQAAMGATFLDTISALLSHSPRIELTELSLGTENGTLSASLEMGADGSNEEMLENPLTALFALSAEGELEIPEPLVISLVDSFVERKLEEGEVSPAQADKARAVMLSGLRKEGYLLRDGDRYRSRVAFRQGQLSVNGFPVWSPIGGMPVTGEGGLTAQDLEALSDGPVQPPADYGW